MKKWLKRIGSILIVVIMLMLPISAVLASFAQPQTIVSGLTEGLPTSSFRGITWQPDDQTFYAKGLHWIFYDNDDGDLTYKTAPASGAFGAETDIATVTGLYGWEFAVWYDQTSDTVHIARHNMTPDPDEVQYRMATPNADGTLTYAAAWQTVSTTPAELNNWRTTICVDEEGYPYIAWVDTNGVGDYGVVYVEASTTKNGTWTQDATVSTSFDDEDYHAWFVGLTPVDDDKQIQVAWSEEDISGGGDDGEMKLIACLFDDDTGWDAPQEVVPTGQLNQARPDAFDFYDMGSAMWVVYTDDAGAVVCGARSQIQNWAEASFGFIKEIPGTTYIPTISGYRENAGGVGEDFICIVHSEVELDYAIHYYGDDVDEWTDWNLIWVVPDLGSDTISRHIATYKFSSPLGFSWQYNDDSEDTDTVMYWWVENDQLGYYAGLPDSVTPLANLVPLLFLALGFLVILMLGLSDNVNVKMLIYIAIAVFLVLAFLVSMNAQLNMF